MKKLFTLLCMVLTCVYCLAQDRNNEDEVVKIDWYNQHATKEGELIVKFADHTMLRLQNDARGTLQATGMSRVDALLQRFPVAKAERLCPNDNPNRQLKTSKSYNGPDVVERDLSRLCRFVMQDPRQTYEMIEALKELDEVEFAEPNYMAFALGEVDNAFTGFDALSGKSAPGGDDPKSGGYFNTWAYTHEPMYPLQWGLQAVNLPQLWASDNNTNTDRAVIAILDTGVDIDHPDLAANIWTNPGENENGYDDDNNGFADDIHGWDFVNWTADIHDWNSHGTHCAGIAAAVGDNHIGMTGANPMAYIMPVAVLQSNGTGDIATVIQGINYAKNNGADVISMSFGTYSYSIALEQALAQAYQNSVLVAASGNDGMGVDPRCSLLGNPMFPAALTFVFGVEATTQNGQRAGWTNYDCDGPTFSQYGEEQLYNYELQAPGATIYSTVPNGNYRAYSGTSMSAPLVAGGISALLHAKPYASQEMLWGDLINTSGNHVNFKACYDMGDAPAQLDFVCFEMDDTINGDGDGRPDAGETIYLYPTLRSTWGATNNILMWLTVDEYENPDIVTFLDAEPVAFGQSLSAYAKSKSVNPLRFTIDPDCVDGRTINMVLHLTANPTQYQLNVHFTIQVENGVELGGVIMGNYTLYPNVHYIVTQNLAMSSNDTLFIKPGTIIKIKDGCSINAKIEAIGKPDSMIVFTKTDLGTNWNTIISPSGSHFDYCLFEYMDQLRTGRSDLHDCIVKPKNGGDVPFYSVGILNRSNVIYAIKHPEYLNYYLYVNGFYNCNLIINIASGSNHGVYGIGNHFVNDYSKFHYCNFLSNKNGYMIGFDNQNFYIHQPDTNYYGSAREDIFREQVYDFVTPNSSTFGYFDFSRRATRPFPQAHGVVWKVVVNGYDTQDEFEQLPPLGCGRHIFEVYFNRAMDTLITPMLTMGVRPPYTQHAIAEDGHWSADSTIYTAYLTINGTTATDGLNRIYVANAKDNEHFEIPIEDTRFNVQVSSAGSLSNEFMANPGLGKVDLEWNNNEVDFEDFLGYNMYRSSYDTTVTYQYGYHNGSYGYFYDTIVSYNTIQINDALIQDTLFTDYDVVPGTRYWYYYKVLRTNLSESDASLTVTTVPFTSIPGDANGSMVVDVADVVSIVSYLTNGNPQPFIFEAADVNGDGNIDILDIVGVINIITNRGGLPDANPVATAYYSVENGILFVDTPVELGGVQFVLNGIESQNIEVLQALEGFEQVRADVSEGTLFMAYSMSGKRLPAGKHALLRIGEGGINSIALSDPEGHNVLAIFQGTGVEEHETLFLEQPYPNPFNGNLTIPFIIADERANNVVFTVTNVMGQVVSVIELGSRSRGEYKYEWKPAASMVSGIYTVSMQVNGRNVQHAKVVYVK